jgi:MFS family permease
MPTPPGRARTLTGFAAFGLFWARHVGLRAGPHRARRAPRRRRRARRRGSIVTTLAYLGFLVGPAAVGLLADALSLRAALAAVAGVALLLAGLGAIAGRPGGPTPAATPS